MRRHDAFLSACALLWAPACTVSAAAGAEGTSTSEPSTSGADDDSTDADDSLDDAADDDGNTTGTDDGTSGADATTHDDDTGTDTDEPPGSPCDFEGLQLVAEVLATEDAQCVAWVESVYGRVARSGSGSASVWTLRTQATTGVLLGARHTLGMSWSPGDAVAATLTDPNAVEGLLTLQHAQADATVQQGLAPVFHMWIPELTVPESAGLSSLLPRHDYYVAAIDDQLFTELKPFPFPDVLQPMPPTIVDPAGTAGAEPTYATAIAGESALVLGHPVGADGMAVSLGTVLSDAEAEAAIAALVDAGDEEGSIPYDPEAEMLLRAEAVVGMSGGGVFDVDGRLLGISVRATVEGPQPYVRAVRASFIATTTAQAVASASDDLQAAIAPHLPQP